MWDWVVNLYAKRTFGANNKLRQNLSGDKIDPMMKCIESNGSNDEPANGRNGSAGQQLLFNYTGLEGER